jgi:outer membrane receptor protein involved in Fe transport
MRRSPSRAVGVALLAVAAGAVSLAAATLTGVVEDPSGAPVAGATVTAAGSHTATDARGRFELHLDESAPAGLTLSVEKAGFRRVERSLDAAAMTATAPMADVKIVLETLPFAEQVVVTASRTPSRLADTAASVVVVSAADLEATAAATVDDALRQVPGFILFRRSGSRVANPTAQGVSLRGIGASGASRAVVVADGVPLNDPFGGWVYWGRVPRASLDRIEVVRGGTSDVWGSGALSGAIQLVRRESELPAALAVEASGGSDATGEASLFSNVRLGAFAASLSAEAFTTDGYVLVEPSARGPVDVEAGSRRAVAELALERHDDAGRIFVRGSVFDEDRENGTPLQVNDTRITELSLGGERRIGAGAVTLRAWGSDQDYDQTFSAIASDRGSERLTRSQEVPADALGLSALWNSSAGAHALAAGVEGRRVRGESREEIFAGAVSAFVTAGGEALSGAAFVEDSFAAADRMTVTGSLRFDAWGNRDGGRSTRVSAAAVPVEEDFPDRSESAWSPRVSILYRASPVAAFSASAYRAFRAPTLNELYRSFRVGNVETLANEQLGPERLSGVELGGLLSPGRVFARAVLFWMDIEDPIVNVTLQSTPALVTRRRANLGRLRSRGVEIDAEARLARDWKASVGYLFADSIVTDAPASPELVGSRTPQVPRHQVSLELRYDDPRILLAAVQARWVDRQFEDDQNSLRLDPCFTADALASRGVTRGVEVFVAAENLFDERCDVGRTPVRTIGAPRTIRGGLRLRLPAGAR